MVGISVWKIVILSLIVGAPFMGAALEKSGKTMNRQTYCVWVAVIIVATGVMQVIGGPEMNPMLAMGFFAAGLFGLFLLGQKSVQRGREAGVPKTWCYIVAVPLLGLAMVLFLTIKPPVLAAAD